MSKKSDEEPERPEQGETMNTEFQNAANHLGLLSPEQGETMNVEIKIAANHLGILSPEVASTLCSDEADWIGKKIGVYGPNYIWWGTLKAITDRGIVVTDVWQVSDIPDLEAGNMEGQKHSDVQIFIWSAICQYGPVSWSPR